MEGQKDFKINREVQSVDRGVRPDLEHFVGFVEATHELGDTVVTTLHVVAVSVKGRQKDHVTHLIDVLRSTMLIGIFGLLLFCQEKIVAGFEDISFNAADEHINGKVFG